jgi:TonB family protein
MQRVFLIVGIALIIHAGILLFGGVFRMLFVRDEAAAPAVHEVELMLVNSDPAPPKVTLPPEKTKQEEPAEPDVPRFEPIPDQPSEDAKPPKFDLPALAPVLDSPGAPGDFKFGTDGTGGFDGVPDGPGKPPSGGAIDSLPRLVSMVDPAISGALRRTGGLIILVLLVNEHGRVTRVEVEKTSTSELVAPVIDAVRKWVFEPGTRGGKKSPFRMKQVIRIPSAT